MSLYNPGLQRINTKGAQNPTSGSKKNQQYHHGSSTLQRAPHTNLFTPYDYTPNSHLHAATGGAKQNLSSSFNSQASNSHAAYTPYN